METKPEGKKLSVSSFAELACLVPVKHRARHSLFRRYRQAVMGVVTVSYRRRFNATRCEQSLVTSQPMINRRSRVDAAIALATSHPLRKSEENHDTCIKNLA